MFQISGNLGATCNGTSAMKVTSTPAHAWVESASAAWTRGTSRAYTGCNQDTIW